MSPLTLFHDYESARLAVTPSPRLEVHHNPSGRPTCANLSTTRGSRRDPISLVPQSRDETYGKRKDPDLTNPEGLEKRHIRPLQCRQLSRGMAQLSVGSIPRLRDY